MFKGSIVAIITPFSEQGVDEEAFRKLIAFQLESGTHGILPCGTTGESPTLSPDEHNRVIEITVDAVNKQVPVIAGTGSNSTAEAIALTQHAAKVGADAALVVTPYYNKPTQKGLYLHFKAIAESVDIPIILYNIEGRTAKNIDTETVAKLNADCKNIIGVKEASGSLEQVKAVREACGPDFIILSGDDALTLDMMDLGGTGVISVAANIIPKDIASLTELYASGQKSEARALNDKLKPLISTLFVETNPIPVKKAAELLGLASGRVRLPLCDMDQAHIDQLKQALVTYGALTAV